MRTSRVPLWKIAGGAVVHLSPVSFLAGAGYGMIEAKDHILTLALDSFGVFSLAGAGITLFVLIGERLSRHAPAGETSGVDLRAHLDALDVLSETARLAPRGDESVRRMRSARWLPWTPERASLSRDLVEAAASLEPSRNAGSEARQTASLAAAKCLSAACDALEDMAAREDVAAAGPAIASASYMETRWGSDEFRHP